MAQQNVTWSNWSGTVSGIPDRLLAPQNEEQICEIVHDRRARACGISVVGSGHSYADLVSPTGRTLADLRYHSGVIAVDRAAMTVTVKAGTTLRELNRQLAREGLALPNQSAIEQQTVAGAVATATHGSSASQGSLSGHVVSVRLVGADGEIRTVTADAPELDAVRVHLGCLGVVTALTFRVVPAQTLRKEVSRLRLNQVLADLGQLRAACYGGFWWYPHTSQAVVWRADPAGELAAPFSDRVPRLPSMLGTNQWSAKAAGMAHYLAAFTEGRARSRILRCDEALTGPLPPLVQGLEYGIPVAYAADAISELARTVHRHKLRIAAPVDVRFTAADSAWLSPSYQRDTCYIGVTCPVPPSRSRDGWAGPLAIIDPLLAGYDGRPHWAKVHFRSDGQLAASYPRWHSFVELRRAWDPDGIFLGDRLRAAFL